MTPRTSKELREKYGPDAYVVVAGSRGDMCPNQGMSEAEAIAWYEKQGGTPVCTIVCVPTPDGGRSCHRGWISERFQWSGGEKSESLAIEPRRRKPPRFASCSIRSDGKDIVVTDPCYIMSGDDWKALIAKFDDFRIRPHRSSVRGMRVVMADTIYGDWLCELRGSVGACKHFFGEFTADSGMVCVVVDPDDDAMERLKKLPARCWTRVRKFTGTVRVVHRGESCRVYGNGTYLGSKAKFSSRQIG